MFRACFRSAMKQPCRNDTVTLADENRPSGCRRRSDSSVSLRGTSKALVAAYSYNDLVGGDDSPTQVETPSATPSSGSLESISTVVPGPEAFLRAAEIEQSRRMGITGVLFNVVAVVASPLVSGHPMAKRVAVISMVAAALNNAWFWWASSNASRYTQRKVIAYFVARVDLQRGDHLLPWRLRADRRDVRAQRLQRLPGLQQAYRLADAGRQHPPVRRALGADRRGLDHRSWSDVGDTLRRHFRPRYPRR